MSSSYVSTWHTAHSGHMMANTVVHSRLALASCFFFNQHLTSINMYGVASYCIVETCQQNS